MSNDQVSTPLLPSIRKSAKNIQDTNNSYLFNNYKDLSQVKRRSYSITNFKKPNSHHIEVHSPTMIPAKYFKDVNKPGILNKIRVPKTGDVNNIAQVKENNFMRNNALMAVDQTSRTEDFMRKLNYSYERPKLQKNKIQLKSLNEKSFPTKPAGKPAVFERLTAGLLKNTKKRNHKIEEDKHGGSVHEVRKIKKVQPVGKFGDTGSSFDRIIENEYSESNPYNADYLDNSLKPKSRMKNFNNRSHVFEHTNISLNMEAIKKFGDKLDVVMSYDIKSQVGKNHNKEKKVNQDSYICQKLSNQWIFGVLDGHGLYGHHASAFVKRLLPKAIFKKNKKMHMSNSVVSKKDLGEARLEHKEISHGFKQVHKQFEEMKWTFDPAFSGTTVNVVFVNSEEKKIVCANAGDSRAVLYSWKSPDFKRHGHDDVNIHNLCSDSDDEEAEWEITPLSEDHKPDLPKEHERITKKFGGRVMSYLDADGKPVGPARVWLKTQNIPGLAMSRSLGDTVAHTVGVEWEPEIKEWQLQKEDKILIVASDGLWEFLSNKQVLDTILPFYKKDKKRPEKAIEKLIAKSTAKWSKEEGVVDDTTVILVYLNVN